MVAAQRGQETWGVLRGRPRLGDVGEDHLAGIGRLMGSPERQVEVADDRFVDELNAGAVDVDVGGRPTGHEFVARVDSSR